MTPKLRLSAAALLLGLGAMARAAVAPDVQGVVHLSASASAEVARDLLSVTLTATRDGADAAAVQSALKQALDAALVEARKAAKPGLVDVQTGNFALFPRYGKQTVITGWQGSAELVVEGRDMQAIAALAGRINGMMIARVGYNLSRELRERLEGDLGAQAIGRFRAKATDYAKLFGYGGYALREANVSSGEPTGPTPMPRVRAMAAASDEALPVEPGKGTVTVTVSGSVQLTK
jgi:predicted secreted protein